MYLGCFQINDDFLHDEFMKLRPTKIVGPFFAVVEPMCAIARIVPEGTKTAPVFVRHAKLHTVAEDVMAVNNCRGQKTLP